MEENFIYTKEGKIKFPCYTIKLINSTNSEIDELAFEDISKMKPVVDKQGNPHLMISYYDNEYCLNSTLICDDIEIEKSTLFI